MPPRHRGPILVDTNVILEAHRTRCWKAIASGYSVETVEACFEETQTGHRNRPSTQKINPDELKNILSAIHQVRNEDLAELILKTDIALDYGEQHLWAHALNRQGDSKFCGPDTASLRVGILLGHRDRLVSLEQLLDDIGSQSKGLRPQYQRKWHRKTINDLMVDMSLSAPRR